jgi:hypothetical protein
MPRTGKIVSRFDILKDADSGRRYKVAYVSPWKPATYYLTTVDNGGNTFAFSEEDLRARFDKLDSPPPASPDEA